MPLIVRLPACIVLLTVVVAGWKLFRDRIEIETPIREKRFRMD